jgi:FemAB-related protein (PEP-CTERM system-associated)
MSVSATQTGEIRLLGRDSFEANLTRWETFVVRQGATTPSYHPAWPAVLYEGLGHEPYWIEMVEANETRGILPVSFVRSLLFGKFLVGLPYLNYGGVVAENDDIGRHLVDRAVDLADQLNVRHLELRHERAIDHPLLTTRLGHKVHLRLSLPGSTDELWKRLKPPVRNQIRKGRKNDPEVTWGREDLLPDFYEVFSRNMRDLGTPAFGRGLFRSILRKFPDGSEICVVRLDNRPVAAALLLHGRGVTEVPSASSLRNYNISCANMLMYWCLLERSIQRGQATFDFGRSTPGGSTHRFKAQWGAIATPASWQEYRRSGGGHQASPDNPRYRLLIEGWRRMPVGITRWIGPAIVRGIP